MSERTKNLPELEIWSEGEGFLGLWIGADGEHGGGSPVEGGGFGGKKDFEWASLEVMWEGGCKLVLLIGHEMELFLFSYKKLSWFCYLKIFF